MAYVVGDYLTVRYEVRDAATGTLTDATTAIAVTKPDGTLLAPPSPTHPATGTYDAAWQATVAGTWRWTWTATGTVQDVTDGAVYVWPVGAVVPWVPTRRQVAKYVTGRTLPADQSTDVPLGDFTDATTPTAPQADEHIAAAVAWVATRTGAVATTLYAEATETAAVRAAGMIELSYPVRDADVNTAQALLAQAETMLTALDDASEAAGGGADAPGTLSAWFFPEPAGWGDELIWG